MSQLRAEVNALLSTPQGRYNPVRLRHIEGLLQRFEKSRGAVAEVLAARLAMALARYRADMPPRVQTDAGRTRDPGPVPSLAALRRQLSRAAGQATDRSLGETLHAQERELLAAVECGDAGRATIEPAPDLRAARRFRDALVRLNAERVLEQASAEVPEDAGPLNPQRLAAQSLQSMHTLSPHYLTRLVSYLETLFWLEQTDRGA